MDITTPKEFEITQYTAGDDRAPIDPSLVINTTGLTLPNSRTQTWGDGTTYQSGYLSVSSINLYRKCQRAFYYKYVLKLPEKTGVGALQGSGIHKVSEDILREVIAGRPIPPLSDCLDKFRDVFTESVTKAGSELDWPDGEDFSRNLTLNQGLIEKFYTETVPTLNPVAVEQRVILDAKLPDIEGTLPVLGYIDFIDKDPQKGDVVVDIKTGKMKTQVDALSSTQLTFYALAYQTPNVAFLTMKKGTMGRAGGVSEKTGKPLKGSAGVPPQIIRIEDEKTAFDFDTFLEDVGAVAKGISAGTFDRSGRETWACTPKACPFFERCMGRSVCK